MKEAIDTSLEEFFSKETQVVVRDPDKFRMKLGIGMDAFRYLSATRNLGTVVSTLTGGSAIAGASFAGWFMSLGTLGQIGLAFGIVSSPVGLVAAAGAGGAGVVYLTQRVFRKAKGTAITEVPNFINTPLDVIALSLSDLIAPVLMRIGYADEVLCEYEKEKIRSYFVYQWGLDSDFVDGLIRYDEVALADFNWGYLADAIAEIEKSGDIKYEATADELIKVSREVMQADGQIHPREEIEIENLAIALGIRCHGADVQGVTGKSHTAKTNDIGGYQLTNRGPISWIAKLLTWIASTFRQLKGNE